MVTNVERHFQLADLYVQHLRANVAVALDPFIASRHVGFVAVSAVTVYELALKDIFIEFGQKKHKVLGAFTEARFRRINGRIAYRSICDDYTILFGSKYATRFKKRIAKVDRTSLRDRGVSVISAYGNIIVWRNEFAHEGQIPANVTLDEVMRGYEDGKEVIRCLASCMTR
jgi:hypothetical protein